jgi:sulfite reductase (NADPH) flavoprotein alpha-component
MSLVGFEILPDGATEDVFVTASGEAPRPLSALEGLATLSLASLREITLPDPADASDPIIIRTDEAIRFVDAATGQILREDRYSLAWHVRDIAYRLHTAEGMLSLSILLAIRSAGGFVLALTGLTIGLRRRVASSRVRSNAPAGEADILLLVGSEGGSTMRFAKALHRALTAAGRRVHLAPMNDYQQIVIVFDGVSSIGGGYFIGLPSDPYVGKAGEVMELISLNTWYWTVK